MMSAAVNRRGGSGSYGIPGGDRGLGGVWKWRGYPTYLGVSGERELELAMTVGYHRAASVCAVVVLLPGPTSPESRACRQTGGDETPKQRVAVHPGRGVAGRCSRYGSGTDTIHTLNGGC